MALRKLSRDEKLDWLRLARCGGIGAIRFHRLVGRLGSAAAALRALPGMIAAGTAADVEICARERALQELEAIDGLGATLLAACEPGYPPLLREIADPPPVLTVLGRVEALAGPAVGMVGARNASGNGRLFARAMAGELAAAGLVVASGLARGIDTAAHGGALEAGGVTVAVIASGVDVPYPPENGDLARRIAADGAVISERPLGAAPQARHFPRRNRIISGLALGVVVVEAAPGSGSLITARLAAEQGREVMAVPGTPLDPRHKGTNQLLRDGATLVESAADVLATLRPSTRPRPRVPRQAARDPMAPAPAPVAAAAEPEGLAALLAERLGPEPLGIDELVRQCSASVAEVQDALVDLELSGRLERHPGNRVALRLD
ncbi:MAG TPA: DNA-processing protein DprA [Geminicoccaceae bacterium]|nr:DNA-processing protein DprA [Geminicoccus sp.]HMU49884.1 DNA-processing protein DprA [Geminicoccaceae bacterium]